jgi:hypothetical protein
VLTASQGIFLAWIVGCMIYWPLVRIRVCPPFYVILHASAMTSSFSSCPPTTTMSPIRYISAKLAQQVQFGARITLPASQPCAD